MPDPVTPPAEPATAPPEPPATPIPLADAEGKLRDGWLEQMDEKYRSEPFLKETKNIQTLVSSTISARSMVGKDKIARPNENSSDEEWEAFHVAGGRPETAADYNIVRPDDFPEEHWKDELAMKWMERFHKAGLNPKQVAYLSGEHNADILEAIKTQNDAIIAYQQESKDSLFKRWGAAYEPKMHQGNYAVEKGAGGDAEFKNKLLNMKLEGGGRLGDNAIFSEFTSNLGGKFAEHGDIVESKVSTPADIQAEINKEMQTEAYKNGRHPDHKAAVKRVALLFQEKNKVTTTGR